MTNNLKVDGEYDSYKELVEFQQELIDKCKSQDSYMYGKYENLNDFKIEYTEDGYKVTFD